MSRLRALGLAVKLAQPLQSSSGKAWDALALAHRACLQGSACRLISTARDPRLPQATAAWQGSFAVRPVSTGSAALQQQTREQESSIRRREREEEDAITDQIPVRPMGKVEGASYTVVILAALGLAGAILWAAARELLGQPKEYAVFDRALDRLREDPRITLCIGSPITGYGSNSLNRRQRRQIANRTFTDAQGVSHTQVQFFIRGPHGEAQVSCDMYLDASKAWQFSFLVADVAGAGRMGSAQRILVVDPQMATG